MDKTYWNNKNVLVTGAGGFKGSHLVESLSKSNARIISLMRSFDPQSYFKAKDLENHSTIVIGDLKNKRKMLDILSKYEVNSIFHLGAQPIVTTASINPSETLESNIMGTINILESARSCPRVNEIVVVSSDKAYGPCKNLPYKEDERLEGKGIYAVSKSCADLVSQMYANIYGMPIVIGRCANVFGPGDPNMNRIVPGTINSIIKGKPLEIRSDGKMIREYIYVKDAVEGYIRLAENIDKTRGEAFNLAGKEKLSVLEVVDKISKILGESIKTEILDQAKTEIPEQYLDGGKIKDLLGWEAKTNFEDSIKETFRWYKKILSSPYE